IKAIPNQGDLNVNDLMDVIMPKIRNEVFDIDKVYKEVRNIQESLDRYLQQARTVDQDIADMFLDLHSIYGKLEKLDDRRLGPFGEPYERSGVNPSKELTEKRMFLTNMITFQKSDITLQLNRHKTYFSEAKEAINSKSNK
ncbi:hypothetical protein M5D96_004966, partial [Drosophila gunungcola]